MLRVEAACTRSSNRGSATASLPRAGGAERDTFGHVAAFPCAKPPSLPFRAALSPPPHPILFDYMPLFDVPGWSVPVAPTTDTSGSRKRKRPSTDGDVNKLETAHINFEKLMKKLEASDAAPSGGKKQKREGEHRTKERPARDSAHPVPSKSSGAKPQGKNRKLTKLQVGLKSSLDGARFRWES